jgi:uncharacterized membrane protein
MPRPSGADPSPRLRAALRWLIGAFYLIAGIAHLRAPDVFATVVPDWVPFARETVIITGLCEIAGALALVFGRGRLRAAAGAALALYALCVWPANVKHAMIDLSAGTGLGWWYHAPRLAFQPVIIWWALFAGRVVDWPFGRGRR